MPDGGPSSNKRPGASSRPSEPRKPAKLKPPKKIPWAKLTADLLGDTPTDVADDLNHDINHDRMLLVMNKPRPERNLSSTEIGDPEVEDLDKVKLSAKHDLIMEPEVLRVIYQRYSDNLKSKLAIDTTQPPLHDIKEIFDDVARKAEQLGFSNVLSHLGSRKLRVATMCSGTESPLLALKMFGDSFQRLFGKTFGIEHLFSAEIVPLKQAYIERNFHPPVIFRDVRELEGSEATTAYGAVLPVPTGVDILIAGFSCVDYSMLNKLKKKDGEIGESRDTLIATIKYANKYRPPLVVLENVSGAPWKEIAGRWGSIGYSSAVIKVDTKSYYIPQTRERGYMLCVDDKAIGKLASENDQNLAWEKLMDQFERPASSSIDQFLLSEEDPRVQQNRREMAAQGSKEVSDRTIQWSAYKTRHQTYRLENHLGNKRPLTRWQDNGSCKMPDFVWKEWAKLQPERVWDTLDMNFLRCIHRGFDLSYKLRVLDLSQGIDRETDKRPFGIAGCITPHGIPYLTTRGGPLIGIEALALQGIPIDDLLLTHELPKDLRDLAGNAMSTTVVGAAILSALIAEFNRLPAGLPGSLPAPQKNIVTYEGSLNEGCLVQQPLDLSGLTGRPVSEIIHDAQKGARLCICEGRTLVKEGIKTCTACGHTACADCCGNPSHNYEDTDVEELRARKMPAEVADQLKDTLPMRFTLQGITIRAFEALMQGSAVHHGYIWERFLRVIEPAFGEELYFQAVSRGATWAISYEGTHSTVKLTLSKTGATWLLYVKAPPNEAGNSILRQILSHPVARMNPIGDSLFTGNWKIGAPLSSSIRLTVIGKGTRCESWGSKAGLQDGDHFGTAFWTQLHVDANNEDIEALGHDIRGVYKLLPDCGSANGSLHKKEKSGSLSAMYLFGDPSKLGSPELDSYVFAWDHDRLDHSQSRIAICELTPLWKPSRVYESATTIQCFYRKEVDCVGASIRIIKSDTQGHCWVPRNNFVLDLGSVPCHQAHITLLGCAIPVTSARLPWTRGTWSNVNLMETPSILQDFAWLVQRARSITAFSDWREPSHQKLSSDIHCVICSPEKPKISWSRDNQGRIKPYEDPIEAGKFERQLKDRPPPFMAFTRIDEHGIGCLQLCVNPTTLIHQARSKLGTNDRTSVYWRLSVEDVTHQDITLPPFTLKSNRFDPEHAQPPGFRKLKLRPEQLRSLSWMIEQEGDEISPFEEEEIEEAVLLPMNWRAEGKATASKAVRGGVLADAVGYGKTVTILGLIDSQFSRDLDAVPSFADGVIPLKATLIFVPDILVQQWKDEIAKFLGKKYRVLVISGITALTKLMIRDMQNADIVLASWSTLLGESYYGKVERFAVTSETPAGKGRVFTDWFSYALPRIADHVNILRSEGKGALLKSILRKRQEMESSESSVAYTVSKRLTGRAYAEAVEAAEAAATKSEPAPPENTSRKRKADDTSDTAKAAKKQSKVKTDEETFGLSESINKKDWQSSRCPLLHMFEFNRLVVDEFTYANNKNYAGLLTLRSRAKWILSGTPPLNNFADVKTITPFLGISLGVDETAKSDNERVKAIEKDLSAAESFHSFSVRRSAAWHKRRHDFAQSFLDHFMRQNYPEIDEIPWTEHILPVVLSPAERAIYLELYMQVMAQNMGLRKSGRSDLDNDQVNRLDAIIGDSKTSREALLKRCSLFDPQNVSDSNDSGTSCRTIIATRERQLGELSLDIARKLKLAVWLDRNCIESSCQFEKLKNTIVERGLGDADVNSYIRDMIAKAVRCGTPDDGNEFYTTKSERDKVTERLEGHDASLKKKLNSEIKSRPLFPVKGNEFDVHIRQTNITLRRLFDEAISRTRGLRLIKTIRAFQQFDPEDSNLRRCSKCRHLPPDLDNMFVLGQCGHVACQRCISDVTVSKECMVEDCEGSAETFRILASEDLHDNELPSAISPYGGKKFEELVKLLQDTSRIREDDQVILFAQFDELIDAAKIALKANGITHAALATPKKADGKRGEKRVDGAKIIENFQRETIAGKKYKVLLLNLSGETAAGLNLQNANHVIFLSPVLANSQYDYDSIMTQTTGRCLRYGQKKHVHIYHFLALNTIDVNILQHRREQIVVKRDGKFLLVDRKEAFDGETSWRGHSLDGGHADGDFDQ